MPKIHKSKILEQETKSQNNEVIDCYEPEDLKLRPIISGTSCPTRSLSDIIDKILKPLLKHVKSYIKDSIHYLNKSKRTVKSGTIIVTFDISCLYTSIPHDLGIEALTYYLRTFNHTIDSRFNINFILEATNFILKNNTFIFNGDNFLQLMGTAMGTIFAPTYATLVLGYLEMKLYTIMEWKYDITMRKYIEDNWDRNLDDCIILLDENKVSSLELLNILNNLNRSIKFTMESSEQQLPFLDIMLNINERKVWMDLYSKPTDSKRYVPFDSCHPKPMYDCRMLSREGK